MLHAAAHGLALDEATIQDFRAGLREQVILPGDVDYDDASKVWNGMIDRRPALIARCAGVADVSRAVRLASSQNLLCWPCGAGRRGPSPSQGIRPPGDGHDGSAALHGSATGQ
jgi:hypothetical protein